MRPVQDHECRLALVCSGNGSHRELPLVTLALADPSIEMLPFYVVQPAQVGESFRRALSLLLERDVVEVNCPHCPPRPPMSGESVRRLMSTLPNGITSTVDVSTGATVRK